MTEEWRIVQIAPDYEVSSLGRVRRTTAGQGTRADRTLTPWPTGKGYLAVTLYRGGRSIKRHVHALVCEAFHGPRPPGHHAAHSDGKPAHNTAQNVQWKTVSDNHLDKIAHGTMLRGDSHPRAAITSLDVRRIRQLRQSGETCRAIAEQFGIAHQTVSDIANHKTWRHVS